MSRIILFLFLQFLWSSFEMNWRRVMSASKSSERRRRMVFGPRQQSQSWSSPSQRAVMCGWSTSSCCWRDYNRVFENLQLFCVLTWRFGDTTSNMSRLKLSYSVCEDARPRRVHLLQYWHDLLSRVVALSSEVTDGFLSCHIASTEAVCRSVVYDWLSHVQHLWHRRVHGRWDRFSCLRWWWQWENISSFSQPTDEIVSPVVLFGTVTDESGSPVVVFATLRVCLCRVCVVVSTVRAFLLLMTDKQSLQLRSFLLSCCLFGTVAVREWVSCCCAVSTSSVCLCRDVLLSQHWDYFSVVMLLSRQWDCVSLVDDRWTTIAVEYMCLLLCCGVQQ